MTIRMYNNNNNNNRLGRKMVYGTAGTYRYSVRYIVNYLDADGDPVLSAQPVACRVVLHSGCQVDGYVRGLNSMTPPPLF